MKRRMVYPLAAALVLGGLSGAVVTAVFATGTSSFKVARSNIVTALPSGGWATYAYSFEMRVETPGGGLTSADRAAIFDAACEQTRRSVGW